MLNDLIWPPEALFFDRDGTLIKHISYLSDPDGVDLEIGVGRVLSEAKSLNCRLFLHTNQSGIGRGYFQLEDAVSCNQRMIELIGLGDDLFDEICIAPEDPTKDKPVYRKPQPRFAEETSKKYGLTLSRCYMVGDSVCDVETGVNAGMISIALWKEGEDIEKFNAFRKLGVPIFGTVLEFWTAIKKSS